jgi:vacuolar-type H+-ATPase subunit I/STV1
MIQTKWRALLGKSTCLLIAALASGCLGSGQPAQPKDAVAIYPEAPQLGAPAAAARPLWAIDSGPTVLERLAQATQELELQRQRSAQLEQQLAAEKLLSDSLATQLTEKAEDAARLQQRLAETDLTIEQVRAEAAAAEALQPELLVLQAELDAARDEISSRKKELLALTLRLEDIYRVLIKEFEARATARAEGEQTIKPE